MRFKQQIEPKISFSGERERSGHNGIECTRSLLSKMFCTVCIKILLNARVWSTGISRKNKVETLQVKFH